jgi:large subunit ribosomal protein L5
MTSEMQKLYTEKVIPAMQKQFGYKNILMVPRIQKVVVNAGTGKMSEKWQQEEVAKYLTMITAQKSVESPAKKSIATFKVREGQVIGHKVTIRGPRMYDFLTRLVYMGLPRTRDFRGINLKAIDQGGNLTIGVKEHIIFPETIGEEVRMIFGCEVTIVTNARSRKEAEALFRLMGFPLQKESGK